MFTDELITKFRELDPKEGVRRAMEISALADTMLIARVLLRDGKINQEQFNIAELASIKLFDNLAAEQSEYEAIIRETNEAFKDIIPFLVPQKSESARAKMN